MTRTILITGANRGVGLAMAQAAAERGDAVLATARSPQASRRSHGCAPRAPT